ncbi:UNVERIFIED_CONTAM: hypothetical protein NCL1_10421 [Trichonephila clavipes]
MRPECASGAQRELHAGTADHSRADRGQRLFLGIGNLPGGGATPQAQDARRRRRYPSAAGHGPAGQARPFLHRGADRRQRRGHPRRHLRRGHADALLPGTDQPRLPGPVPGDAGPRGLVRHHHLAVHPVRRPDPEAAGHERARAGRPARGRAHADLHHAVQAGGVVLQRRVRPRHVAARPARPAQRRHHQRGHPRHCRGRHPGRRAARERAAGDRQRVRPGIAPGELGHDHAREHRLPHPTGLGGGAAPPARPAFALQVPGLRRRDRPHGRLCRCQGPAAAHHQRRAADPGRRALDQAGADHSRHADAVRAAGAVPRPPRGLRHRAQRVRAGGGCDHAQRRHEYGHGRPGRRQPAADRQARRQQLADRRLRTGRRCHARARHRAFPRRRELRDHRRLHDVHAAQDAQADRCGQPRRVQVRGRRHRQPPHRPAAGDARPVSRLRP